MTFQEFQASARVAADLSTVDPDAFDYVAPGRVYAGNLYIEGEGPNYSLTVGNHSLTSDDLAALERDLFDYGVSEGIL